MAVLFAASAMPLGVAAQMVIATTASEPPKDVQATLVANDPAVDFTPVGYFQRAIYTFTGTAGRNLSVVTTDSTLKGGDLVVYRPDCTRLAGGIVGMPVDLLNLKETGTYKVAIHPDSAGAVKVRLVADELGTVKVGGAPLSLTLQPGQNATVTFDGTAGQNLRLDYRGLRTDPGTAIVFYRVYRPDGSLLSSVKRGDDGAADLPTLPATGLYTLQVDPQGTASASATVKLSTRSGGAPSVSTQPGALGGAQADQGTPLDIGGAPLTLTLAARQHSTHRFAATAGQHVTVVTTFKPYITRGRVTLYRPDGAPLDSVGFGDPLDVANLTDTGVYTLSVDAENAGTIALQLLGQQTGEIKVDADPLVLELPPSQHGSYTFHGTAGQGLGLGWSLGAQGSGPTRGAASFRVLKPDGTLLFRQDPQTPPFRAVMPTTGTYTLMVDPVDGGVTSVAVSLSSEELGGVLAPDAPARRFASARPGRNASYSLSGKAGESYSVVTSENTFKRGEMTIYRPDGKILSSNGFYAAVQAVNLPETGTYTVFVRPDPTEVGSMNVGLVANKTGTIRTDGTPVTLELSTGQYAAYTFQGIAGQTVNLSYRGASTRPAGGIVVYRIEKPDGSVLLVDSSDESQGSAQATPRTTGTHTLVVGPRKAVGTALTVMLSTAADGPPVGN